MPNVGEVLKSEISRLSKRVIRQHLSPLQSSTSAHRKQLAALKKQVLQLQREVAALQRASKKSPPAQPVNDDASHRFSAKGLKSLRVRLGLSAEELGRLLGVSAQTVYNWEAKKTVPRATQLPAIAKVRNLGKREAQALLRGTSE